ncbi:MAG: hypothetical protein LBJ08_07955, partial [Bifidobacteriaceae bacterium]|nr:hypothetical protein [Bifidobacteriaceae bacterium]
MLLDSPNAPAAVPFTTTLTTAPVTALSSTSTSLAPPVAARTDSDLRPWIMPRAGHSVWTGTPLAARPRKSRLAHPAIRVRWRRSPRRWTRLRPFALVTSGGRLWQLRPRPNSEPTWTHSTEPDPIAVSAPTTQPPWTPPPVTQPDPRASRSPGARLRELLVPVVGALAIGGVMIAVTRNPVFAMLPLLGVLGYLGPALARQRKRVSVIDMDGAGVIDAETPEGGPARSGLALAPFPVVAEPGQIVHVGPDPGAAADLVRTWLLSETLVRRPGAVGVRVCPATAQWAWTRWLNPQRPEVTAIVHLEAPTETLAADAGPSLHLILAGPPPPGAMRIEAHPASLGLLATRVDGGPHAVVLPVGDAAADALARRLAGRRDATGPVRDIVAALPLKTTAQRWAASSLRVPIGVGADGSLVWLDLPSDGPHLLVAGATGSGKSEFRRALMLGGAVASAPGDLVILGIDHKGGATFSDLHSLPHLAGVVTDLDAERSRRAIVALAAELTRRERILADRGLEAVTDLAPSERPPRILVVVDEFRNLIEVLPDATSRLERLAAQGRSLGMHLVLATQRPAGAVSAHLRANLASRLCFRVATDADSMDVIDAADAARIDPDLPGTCLLATSGRPRRALRALLATSPAPAAPCPRTWPDSWDAPAPGPIASREQVARALGAFAEALGCPPAAPPWLPALPDRLTLADVAAIGERAIGDQTQNSGSSPAGSLPADRADRPLTCAEAQSPDLCGPPGEHTPPASPLPPASLTPSVSPVPPATPVSPVPLGTPVSPVPPAAFPSP